MQNPRVRAPNRQTGAQVLARPLQESANLRASDRTAQKVRRQEQDHEYAEAQFIALGAPCRGRAATEPSGCRRPWSRSAPATYATAAPTAMCSASAVSSESERRSNSASLPADRIPNIPPPSRRPSENRTGARRSPARRAGHPHPPPTSRRNVSACSTGHPPRSPVLTSYDLLGSQGPGGAGRARTRVPHARGEKFSDPAACQPRRSVSSIEDRRRTSQPATETAHRKEATIMQADGPHPPLPATATSSPPSVQPARAAYRPSPRLPGGRR